MPGEYSHPVGLPLAPSHASLAASGCNPPTAPMRSVAPHSAALVPEPLAGAQLAAACVEQNAVPTCSRSAKASNGVHHPQVRAQILPSGTPPKSAEQSPPPADCASENAAAQLAADPSSAEPSLASTHLPSWQAVELHWASMPRSRPSASVAPIRAARIRAGRSRNGRSP